MVMLTPEAHRHVENSIDLRALLRIIAWLKFGYDPDQLFGSTREDGFPEKYSREQTYP